MRIPRSLFNQILTLQTETKTSDGMGGFSYAWSDLGSFRGRISPLSAQERLIQDKNTMATTHRVFCDPMTVTSENRIKWGSFYFEIEGIRNPSELYHHLEMDVREIETVS